MILEKYILPEKYQTGHEGIDEQHAQLFSILMGMTLLVKKPSLTVDSDMHQLLHNLQTYTQNHFKYEERIMEKMNYPDLEFHRDIHNGFVHEMLTIQKNAIRRESQKLTLIGEMAEFVRDWYLKHVLIEDKRMVDFKIAKEKSEQS